ncbi:uncharacterized protein LOC141852581 [Brevipalpus obovatus]|uniref:uncharacterized protein LOC141852581 n=1 Tax=Brevipalpus obovatus TaxID=246614 RepID=UPI003D9F2290
MILVDCVSSCQNSTEPACSSDIQFTVGENNTLSTHPESPHSQSCKINGKNKEKKKNEANNSTESSPPSSAATSNSGSQSGVAGSESESVCNTSSSSSSSSFHHQSPTSTDTVANSDQPTTITCTPSTLSTTMKNDSNNNEIPTDTTNNPSNTKIDNYVDDAPKSPIPDDDLDLITHLVIENLSPVTSIDTLRNIFGRYGRITRLFSDYLYAKHRLTVWLDYDDPTCCERVIKMENNRKVNHSVIKVRRGKAAIESLTNKPRSSSMSSDDGSSFRRGILKYPRGWQRRAFSESHADDECDVDNDNDLSNSLDCLSLSSDSPDESQKPKKCVHFNCAVSKTTFFQNSAILSKTRAKRNRRRNFRQANSNNVGNKKFQNGNQFMIGSRLSLRLDETVEKLDGLSDQEMDPKEEKKIRSRQDSGYDSETTGNNNGQTFISNKSQQSCGLANSKSNKRKFTVEKVDLVA